MHTLACGVAAARAIESCAGIRIGLKWVNDLLYDGKKVGGILAEMPSVDSSATTTGAQPPPLVLGIGINLRFDAVDLPNELRDRIDWLERLAGQPVDPNQLLAFLAKYLEEQCDALATGRIAELINSWKEYSVTLGRTIRATSGTSTIEGIAVNLSESGGLIVETKDRGTIILHAGEVTIRGTDGSYA
jgi:BirA family biotin operon repressor/biotin-[acetyl-CoA-carboxylase] ligase